MTNLFTRFAATAQDNRGDFLQMPDGARISYAQMLAQTAQVAQVLAELGIRPGERIAVQVEKSPAAVLLYLACLRIGAVFVPLNPAYTLVELAFFIGDCAPALIVCDPGSRDGIQEIISQTHGIRLETIDAQGRGSLDSIARGKSGHFTDVATADTDLAAILYTSGTTGRSKGAMLSHANLASNALTLTQFWQFTHDDVLIHALPIFHTHGLFVALNVSLLSGARVLFLAKFDADAIIALLPQATTLMGVPTFYSRLLAHSGLTRESASSMRLFISGSAPLLAETHEAFSRRTGHAILERYGMTETNMNTSNPYAGERIAGTVGMALPGIEVRIADVDTGRPLAVGEIGMIEIRGPNVFQGYWQLPERTQSEFRADGFFITGDLGVYDAGGYLRIVGRSKDLIITGGFNVYPKEIEIEIDALPGVIESAAFGVPHPDFGEAVIVAVVTHADSPWEAATLHAALNGRLARFKHPKHVIFLNELPRNVMGKVQKNILRQTYSNLFA